MALTPGEQELEQTVLNGLGIVASIAGAVGGIALPGALAAIPIVMKIIDEAKIIQTVAADGGKAIPIGVAIFQAIENLGIKPMDANDIAKMKPADDFA